MMLISWFNYIFLTDWIYTLKTIETYTVIDCRYFGLYKTFFWNNPHDDSIDIAQKKYKSIVPGDIVRKKEKDNHTTRLRLILLLKKNKHTTPQINGSSEWRLKEENDAKSTAVRPS